MTAQKFSSLEHWYNNGPRAPDVRSMNSAGGMLNMLEAFQPAGDVSIPPVPELVLFQDLLGGSVVDADQGGGRFKAKTEKGGLLFCAPDFAVSSEVANAHHIRSFTLPLAKWQNVIDEAFEGSFTFDNLDLFRGAHTSPVMLQTLRNLWALSLDEGAPSNLLTRAAGCEILAEMCRMGGASVPQIKSGLAPWAERRCIELMHARFAEDISLDELASEARLSSFHFSRMFKQSVGVALPTCSRVIEKSEPPGSQAVISTAKAFQRSKASALAWR